MPDLEVQQQALAKTIRTLRISMVLLVALLGVAVLHERFATAADCWQTSLSAYWYTPARPVLVGVLVAIGICLVSLKASSELEDGLLNVAGLLAPLVAFVPVPRQDISSGSCPSRTVDVAETLAAIDNTVTAYLVIGVVAWLLAAAIAWRARQQARVSTLARLIRLGVTAALLLVGIVWFAAGRDSFVQYAHYAAAVPMFIAFVAVVLWSARRFGLSPAGATRADGSPRYTNRYLVLASAMVLGAGGLGLVGLLTGWDHVVLAVEAWLITLFAVFWVLQTVELWDSGLRRET